MRKRTTLWPNSSGSNDTSLHVICSPGKIIIQNQLNPKNKTKKALKSHNFQLSHLYSSGKLINQDQEHN